jgi:hypothetical protein
MRWGNEFDVAIIPDENVVCRRAAACLAKYSTRSTEYEGVLDHAVNRILAAWGYCWCRDAI